jgi:hypothetical protein
MTRQAGRIPGVAIVLFNSRRTVVPRRIVQRKRRVFANLHVFETLH